MTTKDLMKNVFATIRVPRSKIEVAECLELSEEELMPLLDSHCPEGHIVHENDGHVQIISFYPDLCGYISPEGKQCKTRPRHPKLYCAGHYPKRSLSSELRLLAVCLEEWGLPFSKGRWNWPKSEEALQAKRIFLNFCPKTKKDREFIALVARLQEKANEGELTKSDKEKLLATIRRLHKTSKGQG